MNGFTLEIRKSELDALKSARSTSWMLVRVIRWPAHRAKRLIYRLRFRLLSRPWGISVTRFASRIMRGVHPVPRFSGLAIPLRAADLKDMLERADDFNGAEAMCPRLPAGEVVLGIDWTRRHAEERARLEQLVFDWTRRTSQRTTISNAQIAARDPSMGEAKAGILIGYHNEGELREVLEAINTGDTAS